ncbi:MAG: hypothetical protein HYY64_07435 [Candidatus Rokubacteria bacterium]|nr:hypothetical protein [Candidatus Rokubacteria bacterium]
MEDLKAALRKKAAGLLARLSPPEREALLVKNWMSHDARWFMAVAKEYGLPVANRLNRIAAHELGKAEAQRLARALDLRPPATVDDYLLVQETFISLLGPDLLDYRVTRVGDNTFRVDVQRCFAHDNAVRAGITEGFECGIFARITGWLDALGLAYETSPPLGPCLKAQGRECGYTITLKGRS